MQSRSTLFKNFLALLIFFSMSCITFRSFLISEGIVRYRDLDWPYDLEEWQNIIPYTSENLDLTRRFPIIYPTFSIALQFNIPSSTIEKLYFLITTTFIGFSAFWSTRKLLTVKSEKNSGIFEISLIAGFFYTYNPFAVQFLSPSIFFSISYGLLPLIFYFFDISLHFYRLKYIILTAFFWALAVSSIIQFLVLVTVILIPWLLFHVLTDLFKKNLLRAKKKVLAFLCVITLFFMFSFYWILPTMYGLLHEKFPFPDYILTLEMLDVFSQSLSLTNVIRLMGVWWPRVPLNLSQKISWLLIILTFITPIFAFSCMFFLRNLKHKNKENIIFLSIMALFLIFLCKGTNKPGSTFYPLLYEIPIVGWLFRVPTKLGIPLALIFTFLTGYTLYGLLKLDQNKHKSSNYIFTFCSLFIILSTSIVVWPIFTGDLGGVFIPKTLSTEEQMLNSWIKHKTENDKMLYINKESQPFLIQYGKFILIKNKTRNFVNFISPLNVKYFVLNRELKSNKNILYQKDVNFIQDFNSLSVFENKKPVSQLFIPNQIGCTFGGLEKLSSISNTEIYDFSTCGFVFIDQHTQNGNLQLSDFLILNNGLSDMIIPLSTEKIVVTPFDSTYHHYPSKIWSRAGTNDPLHGPWHLYLEQREIENWDFDYGKGLVLTWAPAILEKTPSVNLEDLIVKFGFEDKIGNWNVNFQDIQSLFISEDAWEGAHSLSVELYNSTLGWKTINSPLIPVKYGDMYMWEFYVKGENSQNIHVKLFEYDKNRKIIDSYYITNIGSGIVSWKEVSFNFFPSSTETAYMQLQIWHGYETEQPLPNKIWIDAVKIYDLRDYLKSNILDMSFTTQTAGVYDLYVRYFQNKDGGKIALYLDGNPTKIINTKNEINGFLWKKIDTYNLSRGKHILTLDNREGFNAVNLFALIPQAEIAELEQMVEKLLQNKTLFYIFEAESDMYKEGSSISNKYGGESSNGEVIELTAFSKGWVEIDLLTQENFSIALKSKGTLTVKIDEKEATINSKKLDWNYIDPVNLKKGKHRIEITSFLIPLLWNFENPPLEWQSNAPKLQTLTLDQNPWEGDYSLKAELNASTLGWKVIESPMIPVISGSKYKWEFYVAGENAHKAHAKIVEYNINNTIISANRVAGIADGNFTWRYIDFEYTPSQNASYIALQVWHGHETNKPLPNKIWIDDVRVYGYKPSDLDVVWLYSIKSGNETLEDVLMSEEDPADLIGYKKIDPTKYLVEVNTSKPFMLSFAEAYDPLWRAYVNGEMIEPIPLYTVINGFWINQTGKLSITIKYEPQKWFYYGLAITITSFIGSLVYIIWDWKRECFVGSRLGNTISCLRNKIHGLEARIRNGQDKD